MFQEYRVGSRGAVLQPPARPGRKLARCFRRAIHGLLRRCACRVGLLVDLDAIVSDGIDMVVAVPVSADDLSAGADVGSYSSSSCFPLLLSN